MQPPLGTWYYGGSTAWATLRGSLDQKIRADHPKFQITYFQDSASSPSTGNGIDLLMDGRIAFAQTSRALLDEEYEKAKQRGFNLEQIAVAYDAIAFVVHPDLPISGLTIEQLVGIYTGRYTNWQELGGPDWSIIPFNGDLNGGAPAMLKEYFAPEEDWAPSMILVQTPSEAIQRIGRPQNPAAQGGIYFASARTLIGQCSVKPLSIGLEQQFVPPYVEPLVPMEQCPIERNQINVAAIQDGTYPFNRRLYVVVRADGSMDTAAGKAYAGMVLSQAGQQLIQEAGFVPIRSFE
jgi:phosphate transport system substrate-binding protein